MAISLQGRPSDWGRVYDTNRLTYTFSSSGVTGNYTQPNFQFVFYLSKWNLDGSYTDLGTFKLHPNADGTVQFNPSVIYKSYLSYDFSASNTNLIEATNSAGKFSLKVCESFGTPPVVTTTGQWNGELGNSALNLYNGVQQNIPYDYIALNILGNKKWVMSGTTGGTFLTDSTEYLLDNNDLAFLYFLAPNTERPTRIRYQLFYMCSGSGRPPNGPEFLGITTDLNKPLIDQGLPNVSGEYNLDPSNVIPPQNSWTGICSTYIYDTNFTYNYTNSTMYYFPMGPYQLFKSGLFPASASTSWLYYTVDILSGNTVKNAKPFYVYRKEKCNRYGWWQLFWLNQHGGWDTFTFDRKVQDNYKYERTTYKQKIPLTSWWNYSPYDAGERVFDTQINEEITLTSYLVTQKESQLLMGLVQSPKVYALTMYNYNGAVYPYGVPYIVTSSEMLYEQKVNSKEVYYEVKIRPSNQKIIQRD